MSLKSLACNERCPVASAEAQQHEYLRGIVAPAFLVPQCDLDEQLHG